MSKLMWEIEYSEDFGSEGPTYIYIETDDDINIELGSDGNVTHITCIDVDIGVEPDLVVRRRLTNEE